MSQSNAMCIVYSCPCILHALQNLTLSCFILDKICFTNSFRLVFLPIQYLGYVLL